MLKPAPSFIPAPGDNVPLAIPDVHKPAPVKEPPNISKLWSEATEDDIENHALTIEVEKQPPPEEKTEKKDGEGADTEGLDLLKDDLSDLTPAPSAEEKKEVAKTKPPDPHGIEALLGGGASSVEKPAQRVPTPVHTPEQSTIPEQSSNSLEQVPPETELMDTDPAPLPPSSSSLLPPTSTTTCIPEEEPPQTPTELSRDNELLQFAKLVDKLHSDEKSMETESARPPSIDLDLPESFSSFGESRRPDNWVKEDHSTMIHGLSPDLKPRPEEDSLPEKVSVNSLCLFFLECFKISTIFLNILYGIINYKLPRLFVEF